MSKTKHTFARLAVFAVLLPLVGLGCKGSGTIATDSIEPVALEYWQVFDEPSDYTDTIARFRQQHPHIDVRVKKIAFDEYEDAIIRALAEGRGPDIISIHTTWLKQYKNIIQPMPPTVTLPRATLDGKNVVTVLETVTLPTLQDIRNQYVETVAYDIAESGVIYGLPLSVDTLALYYNKQLLNQANIALPPATWAAFKEHVKKLTIQDASGNIVQSGAALGGSRNINRAPDLLAVLMMQNGTQMTNTGNTKVTFDLIPATISNKDVYPGRDALRFYADFASPAKEVYTWNEKLPESMQAFANQHVAFFFGYSYHLPLIRALSPGLPVGVAPLPQISETGPQVNFANYWMETVTKQSKHPSEAWAFINFVTQSQNVSAFLANAQKPTALRTLIADQRRDELIGPFTNQLLTARSWYHGENAAAMEESMRRMIEQVTLGEKTADQAITEAARAVNASY